MSFISSFPPLALTQKLCSPSPYLKSSPRCPIASISFSSIFYMPSSVILMRKKPGNFTLLLETPPTLPFMIALKFFVFLPRSLITEPSLLPVLHTVQNHPELFSVPEQKVPFHNLWSYLPRKSCSPSWVSALEICSNVPQKASSTFHTHRHSYHTLYSLGPHIIAFVRHNKNQIALQLDNPTSYTLIQSIIVQPHLL